MENVTVKLTELLPGSAEYEAAHAWAAAHGAEKMSTAQTDSGGVPHTRSVAYWVSHWGGYSSNLPLPDGTTVPVSLDGWRDRDPTTTFVTIEIRYVDPSKVGTKNPAFKG